MTTVERKITPAQRYGVCAGCWGLCAFNNSIYN